MRTVILINVLNESYPINDLGILLDALETRDISNIKLYRIFESRELKAAVSIGEIIVNDGTNNLDIEAGLTYISYALPVSSVVNDLTVSYDNLPTDAFSRLRVSSPFTLFESSFGYHDNVNDWAEALSRNGSSAINHHRASIGLTCTTTDGDKVIRQSKKYCKYQPGKSLLVLLSAVLGASKANVEKSLGYFDNFNGLFFKQTATALNIVRRSNVTESVIDTLIPQSSWNIDKLDGTGASGITLDVTKVQIFIIDLQWLGAGRVRFGFDLNGEIHYCQELNHANIIDSVYMSTATLPVRFEIKNTGIAASNTTLEQICSTVISEGGYEKFDYTFTVGTGVTQKTVSGRRPLLSLRVMPMCNGIINRSQIIPSSLELYPLNKEFLYELVYNGQIGGPSPTWVQSDVKSGAEYYFGVANSTITGGTIIKSGYMTRSSVLTVEEIITKLVITNSIDGSNPDTFTIVVTPLSGTGDIFCTLNWREIQ